MLPFTRYSGLFIVWCFSTDRYNRYKRKTSPDDESVAPFNGLVLKTVAHTASSCNNNNQDQVDCGEHLSTICLLNWLIVKLLLTDATQADSIS